MADISDPSSLLLCDESKDLCFDDLDVNGSIYDDQTPLKWNDHSRSFANGYGSEPLIDFPVQSEEDFASLLERESDYLPKHDYLTRLRCGHLDSSGRTQAFDWISKAHSHYSFGALSLSLAVNYLDRFLSIRELPRDKAWAVQLLAVACLSIAAKMEETSVPQSIEFQVGDPQFVFEAKTIQRMELLVLDTLKWKMNALTPCSFLDQSLKKLSNADHDSINTTTKKSNYLCSSSKVMNRSMELILCTIRGIDFLEFKPSEIAAAVAISVSAEFQAVDIHKATSCFTHLDKARVLECVEMMKKDKSVSNNSSSSNSYGLMNPAVPLSPIGVLESAGFSYKTDDLTTTRVGLGPCSLIDSSSCSPETKRKKLDTTTNTTTAAATAATTTTTPSTYSGLDS